jgi:flagellar hook-associated protein 2
MSGIGSTSTSGSGSSVSFGTNVAPISFPGIASGIDYNSIINKYTSLTIAQATPLKTKVTLLNAQETELLKIQNLVSKLQDTFTALSDPTNLNGFSATSTNTSVVAPSSISGQTATPGSYQITSTQLATATRITNDPAANGTFNQNVLLTNSGASITPSNGTNIPTGQTTPKGEVTINGVTIQYDVNADTFANLATRINSNTTLAAEGVNLSINASGKAVLTSNVPLTVGGANDSGNILSVLKLDTSPVVQSGSTYTITGSGNVGGINVGSTLNQSNNAGFATAVTAGTFTINGVQFTVDPTTQNLNNMLTNINNSSAGVVATYDSAHDQVILTSKSTGPQSIALGSANDTSNFLQAVGFLRTANVPGTLSTGATEGVGTAAVIKYLDASGNPQTAYSNSNDVTNVVPGIDMKLLQSSSTGFTVNVAQDSSGLQTAINSFVTAYNNVIDEINTATQAPVVGSSTDSTTGQQVSGAVTGGGILANNQDVLALRDTLVNYVSEMGKSGSTSYNSLASIGLTLDSSFTQQTAGSAKDSTNSANQSNVTTQTFAGTSGKLNSLNVSTLTAALAANPIAVQKLFTAQNNPIYDLGAYLTTVSGLPTQLAKGHAGTIPPQSLITQLTSSTNNQIDSLQQQINLVTDQANMQANELRAEFTASESQIAKLQAQQGSLGSLTGGK